MPGVWDFLSRFRPAGAPGAGRAAVPADRRREVESELGPVLLLLEGPSAECAEIIATAQQDAEQIVADARSEADSIRSAARRQAEAGIAELVQQAVSAARSEAAGITAAGAAEAAAIRERASRRLPAMADRAVRLVKTLGEPSDEHEVLPPPEQPAITKQPGRRT